MKKYCFFLFLGILTSNLLAQSAFQWDAYGVGFEVTDDFEVITNNSEEFAAISSDELIEIQILPFADPDVDEDDLDEMVLDYLVEIVGDVDDFEADDLEIDSYIGSYVVAAAEDQMILAAFMLDTDSDTNIIVQLLFEEGNEDEAIEILSSFYSY